MKDLTQGSIPRHVVSMAVPMAAGMVLQTIYFFVDLYFVAQLGEAAIAGANAGGNFMFVTFALTQMLGVGTVALMSHAVGRKDQVEANHIFNQSVSLAALCTIATLVGGYAAAGPYMGFLGANADVKSQGMAFLMWLIPGLALQYAMVVMGSGLRATGIVKPTMLVQALTVVLNAILAPILITGWISGKPLGVAGASLATTVSILVGVVVLSLYFIRLEHYVAFKPSEWKPDFATWRRMLNIGLPAGGEFFFMGIFIGVMIWVMRDFGAAAQAGFGVGSRINQMLFVPVMAIAFAATPIAGQNFGARQPDRVRETFRVTATYTVLVMALITALVQWKTEALARLFTNDAAVVAACVEFLQYISWNFIAAGFTFSCSALFQAIGNTWPSFGSSGLRILIFAIPAVWMAHQPWFELRHVYMLSVTTVIVQAVVSYLWLRAEFAKRLSNVIPAKAGIQSQT